VAVSGKPSKTVDLLRKRLRQLLRVVVVLAACVAVAARVLSRRPSDCYFASITL
jgi:hypothetical protein